MTYTPGKALIFSRLPAQHWFALDEAAEYSGWSRSFIKDRVKDGTLPAQEFQKEEPARSKNKGTHRTYRIHVDDLVFFILKNGNGRYSEQRPFKDVVMITETWPSWMRKALVQHISDLVTPPST